MSYPLITVTQVELLGDNPSPFSSAMNWRLQVDVLDALVEPVVVKFVFVGSPDSSDYDQLLDEFDVGPFPVGANEFTLSSDGPVILPQLPPSDVLGITLLQVHLFYRGQLFLKVSYFAHVAYFDDALNADPPAALRTDLLGKFVVMNQPSIRSTPIVWHEVGEVGQEMMADSDAEEGEASMTVL